MSAVPLDVQALASWTMAVNYRAGVERHETLAEQRRWNPDLLPAERRMADELDAVAETMRGLAAGESLREDTAQMEAGV